MKSLDHKNIVKYIGVEYLEDYSGVDIIFEFVSGGSIKSLLKKFGKFEEKVTSLYTKQIL